MRITFRIPRPLHRKLIASAAKKRSMNAEIIQRLEASFATVELADAESTVSTGVDVDALIDLIIRRMRHEDYERAEVKEKSNK